MVCTTFRTIPLPDTKIFRFRIFVTTNITGLRACKKLIYFYKLFALFIELISQECYKHSSAVVANGLSEIQRLSHSFHIKIFNTYAIVGIDYLRCYAGIRWLATFSCILATLIRCLLRRAFLHFGKFTLFTF